MVGEDFGRGGWWVDGGVRLFREIAASLRFSQ
jgi:hypothetical protein